MAERHSLFHARLLGREDSPETDWNPMREESRWVGKPWRRIELLTRRHFWKGEQCAVERDLTLHLGSRKFGLFVTLILSRQPGYDYSEDRP